MLIALHGAGVLNTFHNLTHHAQHTHIDACQSEQTTENQAPNTPTDEQEDKDCVLCLTLHSITPTLIDHALLPVTPPTRTLVSAHTNQAVPTLYVLSDHPARAPPQS